MRLLIVVGWLCGWEKSGGVGVLNCQGRDISQTNREDIVLGFKRIFGPRTIVTN